MKKVSLIFFAFIFVFECFGQRGSKEIIYGTVRADGYQKITKGAMWAIRPEAKAICEGHRPAGYTVVVLDQDYFVRFVDGENNQFDRNYIVFPKGSVVYTDDRTNQFYSAICGNKIEYIRPVDLVTVSVEQQPPTSSDRTNWSYQEPKRTSQPYIPIDPIKEEKKIRIGFVVIPIAIIATGVAAYLLLKDSNHRHPGGAPVRPIDPVDPGGPGGAPPSGGD